jgi:hypothetical protein
LLFAQNVASTGSGTLLFNANGSALLLFLNNNLLASANDTVLANASGTVGMRTSAGASVAKFSAAALGASLAFSDLFAATANHQLSSAWHNAVGTFQVAQSVATATATGLNLATVNGLAAVNVAVQAKVSVGVGQTAGLVGRYSGTGNQNMDYAGFTNLGNGICTVSLWRNVAGTWALLFAQNVASTGTGSLLFDLSGSSLKLYLNDTLAASASDSVLANASGTVGMRATAGAVLADFNASALL